MNALLTGPDPLRLKNAQQLGNTAGYTDRLDYVFSKNGVEVISSSIIGSTPPNNLNSDHAGVVTQLSIGSSISERSADLPAHTPFPISFWQWVCIALIILVSYLTYRKLKKNS
jgi:hypothetical protein